MIPRALSRRRLQAGALLAPIVIVQGATLFLGAGPAAAPASTAAPPILLDAVLAPARDAAPTPEQRACLAYLAARVDTSGPLRSPMAHDLRQEPEPTIQADAPDPVAPESAIPEPAIAVPVLRLTAILDNRSGGMAAIDGRIVRPGDEVAPGWRLTRIDAANNRILITSADGHTAPVDLPRGTGF